MKVKKTHLGIAIAAAVLLLIFLTGIRCTIPFLEKLCRENSGKITEKDWSVDPNGYLSFAPRGEVLFARQNHSETDELIISEVIYKSKDAEVHGLLVLPARAEVKMPAMILIPGAGVSKESELALARNISSYGIIVFTYDQRGVGETKGDMYDLQGEYQLFSQGMESNYYKLVYDALKAFDLLASASFVDSKKIIMAGESLGGRVAMIASALEPKMKGTLIISSAGLGVQTQGSDADRFLFSVDPDHYSNRLPKLVMMHNEQDKNVPISAAVRTYMKAPEEKRFVLVNDTACNHGYCESMHKGLLAGLQYLYE